MILIRTVHAKSTRGFVYSLCTKKFTIHRTFILRYLAGSDSRPLTNIPHCCLHWEFGPCSVQCGDLPLRTPIHRRLGGPLPRLLSNGTHPHLTPVNPLIMRKCLLMITSCINLPFRRLSKCKAGWIRVTHPCAGRHRP